MKKFILIALTMSLTGCLGTELSTSNKPYNPQSDARIRLYGQNGRYSTMSLMINGKKEEITVGGGLKQAFSSMVGTKENESIGMPATPLSKDPSAHSKLLSAVFFKEFVIPANGVITVNNIISAPQNPSLNSEFTKFFSEYITIDVNTVKNCSGNEISFIPQAGKDYEVAPVSSGKNCGVTVYEIQ